MTGIKRIYIIQTSIRDLYKVFQLREGAKWMTRNEMNIVQFYQTNPPPHSFFVGRKKFTRGRTLRSSQKGEKKFSFSLRKKKPNGNRGSKGVFVVKEKFRRVYIRSGGFIKSIQTAIMKLSFSFTNFKRFAPKK